MDVAGEAERPGDRDMLRVAERCDVDVRRAKQMIERTREAVAQWPRFGAEAGVPDRVIADIKHVLASRVG